MGSTESTFSSMEENTRNSIRNNSTGRFQHGTVDASNDDSRWWQIENEDLILDHQPNVTTLSWHQTEDDAREETDLNALSKIGQNTTANNTNIKDNFDTSNDSNSGNILSDESSQNQEGGVAARSSNTWSAKDARNETQSLDEFKEELRQKRLARQTALQDLRDEIATLRKQLRAEQKLTRELLQRGNKAEVPSLQISSEIHMDYKTNVTDAVEAKYRKNFKKIEDSSVSRGSYVASSEINLADITNKSIDKDIKSEELDMAELKNIDEDDVNACSRSRHANIELANVQLALQLATSENLSLTTELGVTQKQVATLKEVVACCKQMLALKEDQCKQLKTKLSEIEESLAERETKIMSDKLRQEYERQLGNIRQLRQLYEERQRIAASEQENLQRLISIKRDELAGEKDRTKNLEERNEALLKEVETVNKELVALREECNEHKFEKRALKEEMGAINTLFSQMVMGFHGKNNLDIDRLATMLEENRVLLNDMVSRETSCSDGATLPKLLFELVEQAAVGSKTSSRSSSPDSGEEKEQDDGWIDEREEGREMRISVGESDRLQDVPTRNKNAENILRDTQHSTLEGAEQPSENVQENTENTATVSKHNDNNTSCNSTIRTHYQLRRSPFKKLKKNITSSTCIPSDTTSSTLKFHQPEVLGKVASTQEIIGNLPKVWKVLIELLSHHKVEKVQFEESGASEDCYKSVETPNGLKAELSVSKTYIKLKDLILEKKSLVKETNRLKALNSHLDYRLNEQEKRLSVVSLELTKTWHLVGKMQRQHRQLHTQEQILRYQLQQKRRLLSELKEELEYCRRKWAAARAKNDESQDQCNDLRREFARRKLEDANNSAESGYSDSGPQSDDESGRQALPGATRRSNKLQQMFEHSREIKRMQSTSPGRAYCGERVLLRWNSAPPTCGWGLVDDENDDDQNDESEVDDMDDVSGLKNYEILSQNSSHRTNGAIPKQFTVHPSEDKPNTSVLEESDDIPLQDSAFRESPVANADPVVCIQRLEEQCKSLIRKVMETSDTRERLEVQLCHFQDILAPAQYAVPLNELITSKRLERLTRASSAPASAGTLTPREEEYTRKRSERLERLEEESRQLISRIKRTSDRGHYLRCSLDRLHKTRGCGSGAVSREGSFESNTEEEEANPGVNHSETPDQVYLTEKSDQSTRCLTEAEEVYVARRSERLKRLENEGRELLEKLTQNVQRGNTLSNQLDVLHEQHGHVEPSDRKHSMSSSPPPTSLEKRIENIERVAANRSERLRILQEEGDLLIARLNNAAERGTQMINRIDSRDQNRAFRQKDNIENMVMTESTERPRCSTSITTNNDMSRDEVREETAIPESTAADPLLPTPKSVACSCIVFDELAECVTVTTTSSQIAQASKGQNSPDRPKPLAQLSVIAHSKGNAGRDGASQTNSKESLEEMVKRLQNLPFPDAETAQTPMDKMDLGKTEESKLKQ